MARSPCSISWPPQNRILPLAAPPCGLQPDAVAKLLEHTDRFLLADAGEARRSDRQLQGLHLLDAGFLRLHLKPQANGLTNVGQGFVPGGALRVAASALQPGRQPAEHRRLSCA
jgi:hypothetical protein